MTVVPFCDIAPQSAFVLRGHVYLKLPSPLFISRDGPGHSTHVNAVLISGPNRGRHEFLTRSTPCVPCRESTPSQPVAA